MCRQDTSGCSIVRLQYPMDALNKYSSRIESKFAKDMESITEEEFEWADLLVFQRKVKPYWLELLWRAQKAGKKVVYSVDDSVLDNQMPPMNPGKPYYDMEATQDCIKTIIGGVDGFSTTTTGLKATFDKYSVVPVTILPNSLPIRYIEKGELTRPSFSPNFNNRTTIISWPTSSFHTQDVPIILEPMKHILQKYPKVMFALFGFVEEEFVKKMPHDRMMAIPWVYIPKFYHMYRKTPVHFQVAPLKLPCAFNTGKSNLKILDGAIRETATICSPSEEYLKCNKFSKVLENNDTDTWIAALEYFVENPVKVKELGEEAFRITKKKYNIDKNWKLWEQFYLEVLEK